MITEQIDFSKYLQRPTSRYLANHGTFVLSTKILQTSTVYISFTEVEARDHLILIGLEGNVYEFYNVHHTVEFYQDGTGEDVLLSIEFQLTSERTFMRREVYGFLDMLENIGGVRSILVSICGIVMYSLGLQSRNLKFIKELFLVR